MTNTSNIIKRQKSLLETIKRDREVLFNAKKNLASVYQRLADTGYDMENIDTTDTEIYENVYYLSIENLISNLEEELENVL